MELKTFLLGEIKMKTMRNIEAAIIYGMGYGFGSHSVMAGLGSGAVFFLASCALDFIINKFKD